MLTFFLKIEYESLYAKVNHILSPALCLIKTKDRETLSDRLCSM